MAHETDGDYWEVLATRLDDTEISFGITSSPAETALLVKRALETRICKGVRVAPVEPKRIHPATFVSRVVDPDA